MFKRNNLYQICSTCVMDTSDPNIVLNENEICNHCLSYEERKKQIILPSPEREEKLNSIITALKNKNKNKDYDCIIGLSGGIDSSYLAYWASKVAKLRLLAVHVDGGWNSEIATSNIEKLVKTLGIDLHTHVFDWNAMQDLQVAFLCSGVANQDTPQDHAFFAALYNFACKHNIKVMLSGYNFVSESVLPTAWGHSAMDLDQINDIHKKFGKGSLRAFPCVSFFKNYVYYPFIKKMQVISPLNYIDYNPYNAIEILEREIGWKYYGGKHYESRFTKFFQSYWLPERFGFDKRRAHLSSLVLAGIISRDEALKQLDIKAYNDETIELDKAFVSKKLGLSVEELNALMQIPIKNYTDYANNQRKMKILSIFKYIFSLPFTLYKRVCK
ncbi:MAG: N-acetyl sugar amidotransferase [Pseudomonadota bacterium]|jgi:N-acetyl sugar amidotransferase